MFRTAAQLERYRGERIGAARDGHERTGLRRATTRRASRVTGWLVAAVLVGQFGLVAPAAAQVSEQPPVVDPYTLTPKRIAASTAGVAGLVGTIIGGLALVRSSSRARRGTGRYGARVAVALAAVSLLVGGAVVATADGGLGSGSGVAGGIVAVVLGLMGAALGGFALARSHRPA